MRVNPDRRTLSVLSAALSVTLCAALATAWQTGAGGPAGPGYVPLAAHTAQDTRPSPSATPAATTAPSPAATPTTAPSPGALRPADDCAPLLSWIRSTAEPMVTPWGLQGGGFGPEPVAATPERDAAGDTATGGGGGSGGAPSDGADQGGGSGGLEDRSGTNVQEAGIDEPDIVKQDGEILVAVAGGKLHVVDVASQPANLLSSVELSEGWDHQLLLRDRRLLVTTTVHDVRIATERRAAESDGLMPVPSGPPETVLTVFDLSTPASPQIVGRVRMEGSLVSSREHNGLVRLVVRSWAYPDFVMPTEPGREDEAKERNLEILRTAPVNDWLPRMSILRADGAWGYRAIAPCRGVLRPRVADDLSTVSVLTMDLRDPSGVLGSVSVTGGADTVYATTDHVYVAQGPVWRPDGQRLTPTLIHRFDTRDPKAPRYAASASVPGNLLNQWSLSEHEGHLRVAVTRFGEPGGGAPDTEPAEDPALSSESSVHVLALADGTMPEVGRVDGLGRGERIYAVRYVGDIGFVVTFRQVDPLYTLDLSDPAKPRVVGELKIPGYSAYLHPIGDGYLLGVGQDADADGRRTGVKASVFDVRDLANPRQVGEWTMGPNSDSEAEWDHHAFLWWPQNRRLVLPVQRWSETGQSFIGAVSLHVDAEGRMREAARIEPQDAGAPDYAMVRRALMRGPSLLLLTENGVLTTDADALRPQGWLAFPPPKHDERPMPIEDGPA